MPASDLPPAKFWTGVVLFFGIGAGIAAAVAFHEVARGSSPVKAIAFGASIGAVGAWLLFYVVLKALDRINRRDPSARD